MDEANLEISKVLQSKNDKLALIRNIIKVAKDYEVDEGTDLYGFSYIRSSPHSYHITESGSSGRNVNSDELLIEELRGEDNWNNPGAIELMMKAFGLHTKPYLKISDTCIPVSKAELLKEVHKSQHHYFAQRFVNEGKQLLSEMHFSKAIQKFSEAIKYDEEFPEAWYCRAQAFFTLQE